MPRWKALPEDLDPRLAEFTGRMRHLVDHSGLSVAVLADRTGYAKASWERYLGGRLLAPKGAAVALAEATGTDPLPLVALWEIAERAWSGAEPLNDRASGALGGSRPRAEPGRSVSVAPTTDGPPVATTPITPTTTPATDGPTATRPAISGPATREDEGADGEGRASADGAGRGSADDEDRAETDVEGRGSAEDEGPARGATSGVNSWGLAGYRGPSPASARPGAGAGAGAGAGRGAGPGVAAGTPADVQAAADAQAPVGAGASAGTGAGGTAGGKTGAGGTTGTGTGTGARAGAGGAAWPSAWPPGPGLGGNGAGMRPSTLPGGTARTPTPPGGIVRTPTQPGGVPRTPTPPGGIARTATPPGGTAGPVAAAAPAPESGVGQRLTMFFAGLVGTLLVIAAVLYVHYQGGAGKDGGDAKSSAASAHPRVSLPPGVKCAGSACDGKDAETMGCSGDLVTTAKSATVGTAILEVRYSKTCGTAWGRITGAVPGDRVEVTAGRARQTGTLTSADDTIAYTPMIAVKDAARAEACATLAAGQTGCTK
ncbi:DUF2690 domain-containing protein [Streptomyces sp. NPDC040750]|uniref:helix-turn-helix domain-containing protein n=1 Tax=Streptomyces sp. NPDC040750 TaxID=3154491 RepID=UPI00340D291C